MDAKFGGFVIDLNETPLSSPRETVLDDKDDDDVVIIERPFTAVREVKKEKDAGGCGGSGVACVVCGTGFKGKIVGNSEEMKNWKCFKCLFNNGSGERGRNGGGAVGGGRLGLLDINASPPREAEGEGEGVPVGRSVDSAALPKPGGDRGHGSKVQIVGLSSFPARPSSPFSAFSNMFSPDKNYDLLKNSQIPTDLGKSGYSDRINPRGLSITSSNKVVTGATSDGNLQATHVMPTDHQHQTPNGIYLQGLKEYIAERNGALPDDWRVEFEFCNNRLKTFAIYISPDGSRFESMSDVAQHLGLPSNYHPLQTENAEISMQHASHISQGKEFSGATKTSNSRQRQNITRSSSSLRASLSDVDSLNTRKEGFPVQFEDFYLISAGTIDLRPSYHDAHQIWPVGYRSSWHDKITGSLFLFDISDGGDSGPIFTVRRYSCTIQSIPIGSTVLARAKLVSSNGEENAGKDDSSAFSAIDEESVSIQMMLTESSPPLLEDEISSTKMQTEGLDSQKSNNSPSEPFPQKSGNHISNSLGTKDSIGEFQVEGRSQSSVWQMVCETCLHACAETYKRQGVIHFGCNHGLCEADAKQLDNLDSLSKFSPFAGPANVPNLVQNDDEFQSTCQLVAKWLEEDRLGLDAEFVQEILEQLPGVTACSEYILLNKRKHHSMQQTIRGGFLLAKRKNDHRSRTGTDVYFRNSKRPGEHLRHSGLRVPFPLGRALCSKIPVYLIGDTLQAWEFSWRFSEVLGLQEAFSFGEVEDELIDPWLDGSSLFQKSGNEIHVTGDVSSRMDGEVSQDRASSSSCRCTGILLAKVHGSLLKVLVGELLSKVAAYVDPNFDAGESKSKRGRKKDAEYSAIAKKMKLDMIPVNDLTWPEISRRFILAFLSMDGNLESAEIACRESGKVFHCLRGDGGILCGSLTGVAALEADAFLLAGATKEIFSSLNAKNDAGSTKASNPDAVDASKIIDMNSDEVPDWAIELEPVRKLPTNVGARIRRCVNEALKKNPPEWARKTLEYSISKEVYKGNASGPTKRAVISVLENLKREKPQQKQPEKKEKPKIVYSIPDLVMKQCRIVLRRVAAADEDRVFCNLLGRTHLNPDDNDEEGLLGYPAMVSRPLDFRTIDLRLAFGSYGGSHEAFIDDVREVWHNIHTAYKEQSNFIDLAETLSQQFEDLYAKEVLSFVQKTMLPADAGIESEKERDDMFAHVNEILIPKAPWEEGICKVCGMDKDDDNVLLCDNCDSEYHTYCLNPPLIRIPEGNWYCPSCLAGQSSSQSAPYGSQAVKRYWKGRSQRKYLHKNLELLAKLASAMELNEYWELTIEERVFLLKFLCDEALNSAMLRDHIGQCSIKFGDMQQKLRSLNSERKLLKFKEENLVANMAKAKVPAHGGGGELGLDELASVLPDDGKLKSKVPEGSNVSPLPGCLKQMEEGQQVKGRSGCNSLSITTTPVSEASNTMNTLFQQSGKDDIQSGYIEGPGCKNELLGASVEHKDDQNVDNVGTSVDLSRGGNLSASMLCMSGKISFDTTGQQSATHLPSSQCHQCSTQANGSSSQECNDELSYLKSEITSLQESIDKLEAELLKLAVRKEYLGRDSDGRIYWIYGRPDAGPWVLVNGCSNVEEVFEADKLFLNFNLWTSYRTPAEIEELVSWLGDGDIRDRELKECILHWQCNKSMDINDTENDILIRGKEISSINSGVERAADSDLLVTKAVRALEKKHGPCLDIWANDIHKKLHEGCLGEMYRCDCLEMLWSSCFHCVSCHKSFSTGVEFAQHAGGKCKTTSTVCDSVHKTQDDSIKKKMLRNEKPGEKCSGSGSGIPRSANEKHDNGSNYFDQPLEPECPFNFQEILSKFKIETSLKDVVKEVGLIGSNGVVSFLPSRSPYLDDPSLTLARSTMFVVNIGDVPLFSESMLRQSDSGLNNGAGAKDISPHVQNSRLDKVQEVAKAEFVKPMFPKERCQFTVKDRNSGLGVCKSSIIRESSLVPKVGKACEILQCLKINLLDMDAALPVASLKASRSHSDRRCAWRIFVKSASSIYEMVQATIILEDTIKADYLRNEWWYWSSASAAANISTLSALALRIYTLDSAILYEKPSLTDDITERCTPDNKSEKGSHLSLVPTNNLKPSDQLMPKMPELDSGENLKPRTRASKRRKDSEG